MSFRNASRSGESIVIGRREATRRGEGVMKVHRYVVSTIMVLCITLEVTRGTNLPPPHLCPLEDGTSLDLVLSAFHEAAISERFQLPRLTGVCRRREHDMHGSSLLIWHHGWSNDVRTHR